jgi:hypothetical protein
MTFSKQGIMLRTTTQLSKKGGVYRSRIPIEFEIVTGKIESIRFDSLTATVNCGGSKAMQESKKSKRVYVPIATVRALNLEQGGEIAWTLIYNSLGIKITLEAQK